MTESRGARDDSTPNKDEFTFDRPEAKLRSPKIDGAVQAGRDRRASFIMGGGGLPTSAVAGADPRRNPQESSGAQSATGPEQDHSPEVFAKKSGHKPLLHTLPPSPSPARPSLCATAGDIGPSALCLGPLSRPRSRPFTQPRSWPSSQPPVLRASTISAHRFASGAKGAIRLTRSANPPQRARTLSATSPR